MKNILVLPLFAILLIATSVGDEWGSVPYLLKIIPAFILLVITVVVLFKDQKKTRE